MFALEGLKELSLGCVVDNIGNLVTFTVGVCVVKVGLLVATVIFVGAVVASVGRDGLTVVSASM